jgi:hypothetical protein
MFFIKKIVSTFSYMYFIHTTTNLGATIASYITNYTQEMEKIWLVKQKMFII